MTDFTAQRCAGPKLIPKAYRSNSIVVAQIRSLATLRLATHPGCAQWPALPPPSPLLPPHRSGIHRPPGRGARPRGSPPGRCPAASAGGPLHAPSKSQRAPGLHLDERDQRCLADNEIDFMPSQPKAMAFNSPAAGCEECDGQTLALETEELPLVLPSGNRNEATGCGHALN